jgi:AGCS family alanine or glycine:cation symporter
MIINTFLFLLFILSIIYTFKYGFIQLKFIKESKKVLSKNRSAYLTFLMTLASHIGAGNIVGVTTALIYGGPGSLFWMWISCFFTSIFSLIENTLSVRYREVVDGENRGGSCYYIRNGLKAPYLAILFSFFLMLSNTIFFGPLQVNTISESLIIPFGISEVIVFLILLGFAFLVIFKGTKKILKFIEGIVPIMTLLFFAISVFTILFNLLSLPSILVLIIKDAFTFKSFSGALIGGSMIIGLKRSAFSNEAGLGTAPTISAMSNVKSPVAQSYVQVLGVFIDTALMCSLMGLMILVYDIDLQKFESATLAVYIFEVIFGKFGLYLGSFFLFTFAIATWVSSYYAGETNMLYLSKNLKVKTKRSLQLYKFLYLFGMIIGIFLNSSTLWIFVDYGLVFLGAINIYVIIRLEKVFKEELKTYFKISVI